MNSNKTALARVVLSLFAGMMFWSSWSLQAARHAAPAQPKSFGRATGLPQLGGKGKPAEQRRKVQLGRRLSLAVSDPARIKPADLEAVRAAWGADSSKMLSLLREASH